MTHLETYLDCLKILPNEFQREFVLMGELDRKATLVQHELESVQASVLEAASRPDGGPRGPKEPSIEDRLAHLRQLQQMSIDLHNEKLALAKQSKDMIISYAARLDYDIEVFKEDLPPEVLLQAESAGMKKSGGRSKDSRSGSRKGGSHARRARDEEDDGSEEDEDDDSGGDDDDDEEEEEDDYEEAAPAPPAATSGGPSGGGGGSSNKSHKKKNASESPTTSADEIVYCICQQPSYGDMVGCDNEDCQYEWFHFACVGVTSKPRGEWLCDDCKSKAAPKKERRAA